MHVPTGHLGGGVLPPAGPANLLAMVNGSQVALSWTDKPGGGMPTAMVLNVAGSATASFLIPAGETFVADGVPSGSYSLTVTAINPFGASPPSNAVTLTVPAPCSGVPHPPLALQALKSGHHVTIAWQPPASGPAVTAYTLLVSGAWSGAIPTTGRILAGPVLPGAYSISVVASNPCGAGAASAPQVVTVPESRSTAGRGETAIRRQHLLISERRVSAARVRQHAHPRAFDGQRLEPRCQRRLPQRGLAERLDERPPHGDADERHDRRLVATNLPQQRPRARRYSSRLSSSIPAVARGTMLVMP